MSEYFIISCPHCGRDTSVQRVDPSSMAPRLAFMADVCPACRKPLKPKTPDPRRQHRDEPRRRRPE